MKVFQLFLFRFFLGYTNSRILNSLFKSCSVLNDQKVIELDNFCNKKETYECFYAKSLLNSFLTKDDMFHTIKNRVVYSKDKKLYETICYNINQIDIIENESTKGKQIKCTQDIWIHYSNEKSEIVDGFLTKNGIIRKTTTQIDCDETEGIFKSFDKNIVIIRKKDLQLMIENQGNLI